MDSVRRLDYLQAIGVDVWVPRYGTSQSATAVPDLAPAPARAEESVTTRVAAALAATKRAAAAPAAANVDLSPPPGTGADLFQPARERQPELQPATRRSAARESGPLAPEVEAQWASLKSEVLGCTKCALHKSRTQGVFGVGNRRADWLIIGEAPGAEEDRQGEPFVGRGGQLLNAMLRAIGLPRESVFIANVLKSRPPGNRDPKPDEVAACLPYLMQQIALLQPKLMLAVGRIAAQNLLATDTSLGRLRGQVHTFGELNTPLIVTYHPAYLLRTPADKRKAWEDLKFARSVFRRLASADS